MKRQLFLTVVLCLMLQVTSFAQSIKLNNQADPGSAMLEVNSTSKGILIPNVTLTGITDATTIATPAASLLVYNTATVSDVEPGYYYNAGTAGSPFWTRLSTSTSTGTAGDGSETKVTAGTNVTVTGSGTSASPYEVNAVGGDGSETKVTAGTNVTVTGSGTSTSPYEVNAVGGDGSETKVTAGTNVTVTGSGTSASPYEVNAVGGDGSETKVTAGTNVTVTGSGTSTSPYEVNAVGGDGSETKVTAGTNVTVTGSGTSTSPYEVNTTEVDGDVTNELQDLSINGNALTITLNGAATSIDLSPYLDNTDDQTLEGILTSNTSAGSNKITSLADPVSAQDAATKAYVDLLESKLEALEGVKDIDNNRYDIITIGTQTWMAENLKTTRYNDGSLIPLITDATLWGTASTNEAPGYCWYNAPNESTNLIAYGALYNWYAINPSTNGNKNVCPVGWHVPTDGEWDILRDHLDPAANGNTNIAGGKMKEAGLAHWITPNIGATNESGFAGLPGGFRYYNGTFYYIGSDGYWWSSTEGSTTVAWGWGLGTVSGDVYGTSLNKGSGFSVRCLRDEVYTIPDAPINVSATAGDGQATITYDAPGSNGGSTITSYTATSLPSGITETVTQAGSGSITVVGLTNGTAYTFTVTATNAAGTSLASQPSSSVTPNIPSVTIGNQIWANKNLDVSTYRDGTVIPKVDDATWGNLTTGAYCYYNNDSTTYAAIYGKLYNWYAVAGIHDNDPNTPNKTLAPEGWHVPTDVEWTTLTTYLGGEAVAGGKMKEAGLAHWFSPNTGATNERGFAGLPGGLRDSNGSFFSIGGYGYWWSSTEGNSTYAWLRGLSLNSGSVYRDLSSKGSGFSVRCLRDEVYTIPDAPINVSATAGDGQATITYDAPGSNGGSTITSYTATSLPSGITETVTQAGSGSITVVGLTNGTAYTFTVTATNAAGTSLASQPSSSVTPNIPSVTIGNQIWANKNLDVSTYRDGTVIPKVDDATWGNLTTGAYCYYNNDSTTYAAIYGKLYNWYAVAGIHDNDPNTPNKTLAPEGWHVPTDVEWTTLTTYLGGEAVAGGKM
ncbi:MAG: hypothetical protein ACJAVW_002024, partial [Spirosomataceae bacterium]